MDRRMAFQPIHITIIDLDAPLPPISASDSVNGIRYGSVQMIVRLHHSPLGMVELPILENTLTAETYAPVIWESFSDAINSHLKRDGLEELTRLPINGLLSAETPSCIQEEQRLLEEAPFISVVICTHERPKMLRNCLESIFKLQYPNYEVVVVDNAPKTDSTRVEVEKFLKHPFNLRYIMEPNQGQCWARNTGAKAAHGKIIAYTDDDVIVDSHWLVGILRGFSAGENVGGVNGLTIPAELETIEQTWFEQSGGFNKGYEQKIYDMERYKPSRPFYPFSAGLFGTGANFAVKKSVLEKVGYFDPALGAGTITTCGDDLAMYVQILFAGFQLVYEPTAFLQHIHRREYAALQKQIYNYGVGFTAFLTKTLLDHPEKIPGFLLRIPYGLYLLFSPRSFKNTKKETNYPSELAGLEYRGMLIGSYTYIQSRWQTRRLIRMMKSDNMPMA